MVLNKKIMTLCMVRKGDNILLGMKKRGFGQGRWNGFGGKVAEEETIEDAAKRELFEETSLTVNTMEKVGVIDFSWKGKKGVLEVNVFRVDEFSGVATESEEMKPEWFLISKIPYERMWSSDTYWLPLFLENKKFHGTFVFDGHDNVLEHEIKEVTEL